MKTYALRLHPGQDLKQSLVAFCREHKLQAGFILTCVGSLSQAGLRLAARPETTLYEDKFEIVSLTGTLCPDGVHLHLSMSDGRGQTIGGHLQDGNIVRTTAELVIGELSGVSFSRPLDPETGYDELVVTVTG
jgi:predicted DNA-binding protein with PD1-like motif